MEEKRVACLYRVSTLMQVEEDDIPMQRRACKEFIEKMPNWKFVKDYCEKGVSGYKKKAADRDKLQEAKEDAKMGMFDVLLVFMFDRLGRREDETPFVVEWFVSQGIEVWSTKEGQQKFDNRVDKLLNYIRYWQAGGESEKTSIRVKEKQTQMIKEGIYMSGCPPYGYKNVKSGVFSKKGIERKKLEIIPEEAEVVKLVYKLSIEEGWGGHRISNYLNEKNIPTKKNSKWSVAVVNYMLRNPIYKGYLTYNKTSIKKNGHQGRVGTKDWILSENKMDEIVIIDEETWNKSQKIRESRIPDRYKEENMDYENYPLNTKSDALFTGFIKCGYCGSRMNGSSSTDRCKLADGTVKRYKTRKYYRCVNRLSRGTSADCSNPKSSYRREEIENIVLEEIYQYFDTLRKVDLTEKINSINKKNKSEEEIRLMTINKELKKSEDEFETLQGEIIKSLKGYSNFKPEILSKLLDEKENQINQLKEEKEKYEQLVEKQENQYKSMLQLKELIPLWKEEYEKASIGVRKMLLSQVIEEVVVFADKIEIKLKITRNQFLKYAKDVSEKIRKELKLANKGDTHIHSVVNYCNKGYLRLYRTYRG